jgi:hypothetical protein
MALDLADVTVAQFAEGLGEHEDTVSAWCSPSRCNQVPLWVLAHPRCPAKVREHLLSACAESAGESLPVGAHTPEAQANVVTFELRAKGARVSVARGCASRGTLVECTRAEGQSHTQALAGALAAVAQENVTFAEARVTEAREVLASMERNLASAQKTLDALLALHRTGGAR